jgi:hypothetical protein
MLTCSIRSKKRSTSAGAMRNGPGSSLPSLAGGRLGGWLLVRAARRGGGIVAARGGRGVSLESMRKVAMPRLESSSKRAIIARCRARSTIAEAALASSLAVARSRDSRPWQYQAVTSSPTEAAAPFMA